MQTTAKTADPVASGIDGSERNRSPQHLCPSYHIGGVAVYKARDAWDGARLDDLFLTHRATALLRIPYQAHDGERMVWWCAYVDGQPIGTLCLSAWDALGLLLEAMQS